MEEIGFASRSSRNQESREFEKRHRPILREQDINIQRTLLMKERDLHKLNRAELLELLLEQSKEIERLRSELETATKQLEDKKIAISESGSIAEAALKLTNIFAEAQKAADLYLANVKNS